MKENLNISRPMLGRNNGVIYIKYENIANRLDQTQSRIRMCSKQSLLTFNMDCFVEIL